MVLQRLRAVYIRFFRQPWEWWGGCTNPDLSRYVMDYALGWLDDAHPIPELAAQAHDLKTAFANHLKDCRRCQEKVRIWQASSPVPQQPVAWAKTDKS